MAHKRKVFLSKRSVTKEIKESFNPVVDTKAIDDMILESVVEPTVSEPFVKGTSETSIDTSVTAGLHAPISEPEVFVPTVEVGKDSIEEASLEVSNEV